ncbi:hypothetical protein BJ508DRAFT_415572 [Ascobolus immersus RN42]|uniref:Uncharacterized protein n=1 Tax=Ascobolus immersus RN42 TaxID=1160509 RepID=A0A3N4I1U3_ASCIM|nr:hypothetical protein BJ508DRAFT_415572 [Ascobolus immersus RN42]
MTTFPSPLASSSAAKRLLGNKDGAFALRLVSGVQSLQTENEATSPYHSNQSIFVLVILAALLLIPHTVEANPPAIVQDRPNTDLSRDTEQARIHLSAANEAKAQQDRLGTGSLDYRYEGIRFVGFFYDDFSDIDYESAHQQSEFGFPGSAMKAQRTTAISPSFGWFSEQALELVDAGMALLRFTDQHAKQRRRFVESRVRKIFEGIMSIEGHLMVDNGELASMKAIEFVVESVDKLQKMRAQLVIEMVRTGEKDRSDVD